jgi:hypothetical protein
MSSNYGNEEIKNSEDKNIQKLREEFEKKENKNENHPKTSHGHKHSSNSNNINSKTCKKSRYRIHKAFSANKYIEKINKNGNKLNEKISYDFYKKHPGYLYYKEIISTLKNNKLRAFTGKILSKKMKLEPLTKKDINNNKLSKNQKFPKINNFSFNNKLNGKHIYFNNKYNNPCDKNNPFSYFWANKILSKTDFKIGIKGMAYGVPKLVNVNKKDDFFFKTINKSKENNLDNSYKNSFKSYNNENKNKLYYNNFVGIKNQKQTKNEKITKELFDENKNSSKSFNIKKEENNKIEVKNIFNNENKDKNFDDNKNNEKKENKDVNKDNENEFEDESLDEEQQMQFYKNQKNFFKARKDIMEEPEYLEEDNDNNEK